MEPTTFHARKVYRLITAVFGLFLAGLGLYVLLFTGNTVVVRFVAGVVLGAFGINMVVSAIKAKESWLSRLGPLP